MKSQATLNERIKDEQAVREAKADPRAFKPLYERYYKPIFVFLFHRTGDKNVSADLVSQVFLKALAGLDKYEFRGLPFSSWLYRIAVNECNSYFRKNRSVRVVVLEDHHANAVYDDMFRENMAEDLRRHLPRILEKLKPAELQIIELRYLEGRAFKEVAEILNISETYAKVKTYRTLRKMKKLLIGR